MANNAKKLYRKSDIGSLKFKLGMKLKQTNNNFTDNSNSKFTI